MKIATLLSLAIATGLGVVLADTARAQSYGHSSPETLYAQGPGTLGGNRMMVRVCTRSANGSLNVRTGPGTNFKAIARIPNGAVMAAVSSDRGNDGYRWYCVERGNVIGWVRGDYLCL